MSEVTTQYINTNIKYNAEWGNTIASDIVKKYDTWDGDRQPQKTWIDAIEKALDMTECLSDGKDGEIKLKDSAIRRIYRTIVARTYNSTFKTPTNMFTVELEDEPANSVRMDFAYRQKQALLNVLKKAKAKVEFLDGIRNLVKKGELIEFVTWHQDWELIRRKEGFKLSPLGIDLQKWAIKKQLKYDGVSIKSVDPSSFVYDTKRGDFDKALKIRPSYKSYEDIANNETYKKFLSKDDLEKIKDSVEGKTNRNNDIDTSKAYKNATVEVLEVYGDYSLDFDGKVQFFPNMKIVVIGREFVGCFMYNPYILNPFILHTIEKDPLTGRGVPPIAGILITSIGITKTLNKYFTALGLSIRKCWAVPNGTFDGKEIEIKENGIIEYNDRFKEGIKLEPINFSDGLQYALSGIEYFKQEQQDETQVYRQSAGDSQQQPQTLGQAKLLQQNQDIIESCDNDLFNDSVVLGVIEKIASYMANFKEGEEFIKYKDKDGGELTDIINDEVRQGNYIYLINDSSTSIEKKMNTTEYIDIIMGKVRPALLQQGKDVNMVEIVNTLGAAYEQEQPSKIIIEQGGMIGQGLPPSDVPINQEQGLSTTENPFVQGDTGGGLPPV